MEPQKHVVTSTHDAFSEPDRPFYSYVNLDMVIHILKRSVFHPFIACLIPLCLRATAKAYSSPDMIYSMAWAMLVCLYHILASFNHRIANGLTREVDLEEEVVLIAGGAGGLGGLIAETYGMRGVSVAVLDVKRPQGEEMEGVEYYECDAGNLEQVQAVKKKIIEELGLPTIIINCAAAPINGASFSQLSSERFLNTVVTNFIGAHNILKAFLPDIIESESGGTFVTISSVLAHFSPANLSDYAASKAALSAMHTSLVSELRQAGESKIKGILVETGQIGTTLFGNLETPNRFLAPVVETRQVAKEIMSRIDSGDSGIIRLPVYADWVSWFAILPASFQIFLRWLSQIDTVVAKSKSRTPLKPATPAKNLIESSDDEGIVVEKEG